MVDKNTITISTDDPQPLLLEGPTEKNKQGDGSDNHYTVYRKKINVHYNLNEENTEAAKGYLLLGHYSVPDYAETNLRILGKLNELSIPVNIATDNKLNNRQIKLIMGPSESNDGKWLELTNGSSPEVTLTNKDKSVIVNSPNNDDDGVNETKGSHSVGIQMDYQDINDKPLSLKLFYKQAYLWINQQENIGLKFSLIILVGVVISMFWYLRNQVSLSLSIKKLWFYIYRSCLCLSIDVCKSYLIFLILSTVAAGATSISEIIIIDTVCMLRLKAYVQCTPHSFESSVSLLNKKKVY